jgi:hypothetical protein
MYDSILNTEYNFISLKSMTTFREHSKITGCRGTELPHTPLFSLMFCLHTLYLFSIKFLYYFISLSLIQLVQFLEFNCFFLPHQDSSVFHTFLHILLTDASCTELPLTFFTFFLHPFYLFWINCLNYLSSYVLTALQVKSVIIFDQGL